jgi:hypothetical protein
VPDTSLITLEDAFLRGFDVYEMTLADWGNAIGATPPAFINFGGAEQTRRSIFGIAISPTSDVDECYVSRNLRLGTVFPVSDGTLRGDMVAVRNDTPLIGGITAPWSIHAPKQTMWGDTYTQIDGTSAAFGFAEPSFVPPTLRLMIFLQSQLAAASRRIPRVDLLAHSFVGATEELIGILPVYGRRHIRVSARVSGGTTVDLAVNGVSGEYRGPLSPFTQVLQEFPLAAATITGGATDDTGSILVDNPVANFLVLKATRTGGAGFIPRIVVDARDD